MRRSAFAACAFSATVCFDSHFTARLTRDALRIGLLLPAMTAFCSAGDGVRSGARLIGGALELRGHELTYLNAWEDFPTGQCDVVLFFLGGLGCYRIADSAARAGVRLLTFAPAIDTNEPFWRYRIAAAVGQIWPNRIFTIPGELRRQALGSGLVVCRSTHERLRVTRGLGVPIENTEIVLHGVAPPMSVDPQHVRRELDLPDEFLLHVSRYTEPRKNVVRLVEAVGPLGLPLVIAGNADPSPILEQLQGLARQYPQVRLLGFQPVERLQALYAACRVFCLPSLHEGVGLVALEAAAHGAKIVITRRGGPPDYFAALAEYVDPLNVADIRAAVQKAWRQPRSDALREHVLSTLSWGQSAMAFERAFERRLPKG